jgi:Pvc16 N-terminal domain/Carboxypeptidase regulatory-like domain
VIRDLSLTLQAVLSDPALKPEYPELAAAQIVFDRPDESFKPAQTTIDLFLFDVRENYELKSNEPVIERKNGQAITHPAPVRAACTYLATAWPVGGTDLALQEQQLLAEVFQVIMGFPKIPNSYLKGKLAGQAPALPVIATHPDELKNPAEFWSAIGNKLRPSLTLSVTISMDVFNPGTAPMAKTVEVRLGERISGQEQLNPATTQQLFRIGGTITSSGNPVSGANVSLMNTGLAANTDSNGLYLIGAVPGGPYTLRVQSGAASKQVGITIPTTAGKNYDVQL